MREIKTETIIEEVKKLCIKANLYLADDMKQRIDQAEKNEKSALGRQVIGQLVRLLRKRAMLRRTLRQTWKAMMLAVRSPFFPAL